MGGRKSKPECSNTKLTEELIANICLQTNLTDDEVRRRYAAFLEQYPNGLITREQLYDSLYEVWPEGHIEKFASHLFAILDQDGNGTVDFVEYIKLTYKLDTDNDNNNDQQIYLGLVFDMFDRNRNGYLEKHELKPLIEAVYDLSGLPEHERRGIYSLDAQVKYIIKKLDKNGDKRLSKYEFLDQKNWVHDERLGRFFFSY